MPTSLWTPTSGMSQIEYSGHLEFRDMHIPAPQVNDWGVATLERFVRGPADLFESYGVALAQGDTVPTDLIADGANYFLQSWRPYEHPLFPGYNLSYKGFPGGTLPTPLPSTSRSQLVTSLTADGLSVSFAGKTIISATKQVQYMAPQTVYRYISDGAPTVQSFYDVADGAGSIQILTSTTTVTYDDGSTQTIAGNTPAGVSSALSTSPYVFVIGPAFDPILGTNFFECTEIAQLKLPGE